jgi:ATP-dependent Clp protease ATP-binding subunit ClpC
MTDEIQKLIASLRLGDYENPQEKIGLLSAALVEQPAEPSLLLGLLQAPHVSLRLAAMVASRDRQEGELLDALLNLVRDPEVRVRVKLAEVLAARTGDAATDALRELAKDQDPEVRMAVMQATHGRPEFRRLQEEALTSDGEWRVRLAAVNALEHQRSPLILKPLAAALLNDSDGDVRGRCAELIEARLRQPSSDAARQLPAEIDRLSRIEGQLKSLGAHRFPKFIEFLSARTSVEPDPAELAKFGTDLTLLASKGTLPRAHFVDETCEAVLNLLRQTPARSIALVGRAGVGKSALVQELVYRLAQPENGRWHVLRVSPTDFMAGTHYLGEWETRVRELIEAIKRPRRVLLYVPNLSDLSAVGTWSKSDSSVATALAPYLEDGSIVALGETAPEQYERGLGRVPSLRRLFDQVLIEEPGIDRTRSILAAVRDQERSHIVNETLDQILEVSAQFLGHIGRPGCAVDLLRVAIKHEREAARPLVFRDVLDSLSRSTGIPADLLDDSVPLKQHEIKEFFEKRVIGQPKAVEAVVDLVTLIKAGVTDPNRPFGVFLFAGPTGVGKTELARALAEFIFGDAARLKRFDMSEFANYDGFTRLIGNANESGLLTDCVRQHPFSVVLLDEIEKGHTNVFDLCLQIFDAGRLTDSRGRTADFRRTIIILTSNIGSTTGFLGFGSGDLEQLQASDRATMPRELSRFFRPEFLNRLDRIIQFRPLSLEVAERIARREIESVLQRSGIRRRELVVDIDPRVVSLVVREGYSPHFGARPLKRTVERLLLLPLAKAIAAGSLRGRTLLRVTEDGGRVQATVTSSSRPADATETVPPPPSAGVRVEELQSRYAGLEDSIQVLGARKSELLVLTREPSFAREAQLRASVLNDIHHLDHFIGLHQEVGKALRAVRKTGNGVRHERLDQLGQDIDYLSFVAACRDATDLGDALVTISLVDRTGRPQEAAQTLCGMYRALATRRRMTTEVLGEFYNDRQDRSYLLVAGLGAYGLLRNEAGLHQVNRRYKQRDTRSNRERLLDDRELLRVETHPAGIEPTREFQQDVKARTATLKPARKRLLDCELAVTLFHEPSLRSVEFWTTGPREAAIARGGLILNAQLEGNPSVALSDRLVRQYDLGIGPKIKDARTGRTTTRVKQVLRGDVEPLLGLQRE